MKQVQFFLLCSILTASLAVQAQNNDSIPGSNGERRSNQNVMLNASSSTIPRSISLGIPLSGSAIVEDGVTETIFSGYGSPSDGWQNTQAIKTMQLTTLDESALRLGLLGLFPMSTSKTGSDKLEAGVNYSLNQYGQHQVDVNFSTPLGKGWGINLNTYQDFDRGTNHLSASYLQERIQFYKVGLEKRFNEGKGLFTAHYTLKSKYSVSDPYGPFIFVGDGSVKAYDGFNLGRDQYLPSGNTFQYIDVETGEKKTRSYIDDGYTTVHVATLGLNYKFANGMELDAHSRAKIYHTDYIGQSLGGISTVTAADGYTYSDGTPYTGPVQGRYLNVFDMGSNDWLTTVNLKGYSRNQAHQWLLGVDVLLDWTKGITMTGNRAHEVKKDPEALYYNGQEYYVFNTGATYFDGSESRLAFYAQDKWNITSRWYASAGFRIQYMGIRGDAANNVDGKTNNTRVSGWNLKMAGVTKTPISADVMDGAVSLVSHYKLTNKLGLELDAIALQQHNEINQYGNAQLPNEEPRKIYLLRGGINYRNSWLDLQSLITYIRQDNNFTTGVWTHTLTRDGGGYPAGYSESLYIPSFYSMDALGWQTDIIVTPFKGFSFHGLFNFRNPRYRSYSFTPTFSDGYTETYDFSGKNVTDLSKIEIELEPSYSIDKWRFWVSARYYGRQYTNITNSLYFNPRWETFGGIDYTLSSKVSFSMNVVNFLNQKGASSGISAASLATDGSAFQNYLTSGSYIRPFTMEFSTRLRF